MICFTHIMGNVRQFQSKYLKIIIKNTCMMKQIPGMECSRSNT